MPMTYILQKIEDLSEELKIARSEHKNFYLEIRNYISEIKDIPNIKKRLNELESAQHKPQNQTAIEAEKKIRATREGLWEYVNVFNILKGYFPEKTAAKITDTIVSFPKKDTLILIDGKQGPTGKTTLCRKLKSIGYNAEELWKYTNTEREEKDDNFAGIVISLNKFID